MRYHELMVEEVDDEFDFGEDDPIDQPSPLDWRQPESMLPPRFPQRAL